MLADMLLIFGGLAVMIIGLIAFALSVPAFISDTRYARHGVTKHPGDPLGDFVWIMIGVMVVVAGAALAMEGFA